MKSDKFISFPNPRKFSDRTMIEKAEEFYKNVIERRTIREFSDRPVPIEVINECLRAAGSAPSGANMQPWHFVVVSNDEVKLEIRKAAEKEEHEFYQHKASEEWLEALAPLGTDEHKSFLTIAPYLIVVFAKSYDFTFSGAKVKNYYVKESAGIATGILLTALHLSGLVTLTHTPSPMNFLNRLCQRPKNEKPYMIVVTGHPHKLARIPVHGMQKKRLDEIATYI